MPRRWMPLLGTHAIAAWWSFDESRDITTLIAVALHRRLTLGVYLKVQRRSEAAAWACGKSQSYEMKSLA
jgi:hypothetical protein